LDPQFSHRFNRSGVLERVAIVAKPVLKPRLKAKGGASAPVF
jgi:hypothetical protein